MDKAEYKEKVDWGDKVEAAVPQKDVEYFNYIFSPLRAASVAWPYIIITGIGNIVLIMNAFE